ncbi:MAG: hypothetical protein ACFE8J_08970 [Candidatus Heimdallarchaeota archaeon]
MIFKNRKQVPFKLAIFNCIQSLIFTGLAMVFYAGGTFSDPNTVGYIFFGNIFSDLGRFIAHSGESNLISFIIYNTSLFLMGVLLIPFFIALPSLFKREGEGKGLAKTSSFLGILVAISMAGASLTPADLYYNIHVTFGFFSFIVLLPLTILYTIAILQNKNYHNRYAYVYVIFAVMQIIFLLIMSFSRSEQGVTTTFAAGQNVIVISMAISLIIQAYGANKTQKVIEESFK